MPMRDGKTYMGVLKGDKHTEVQLMQPEPALVLGDECLVSKEMSKALFGRVKEFASLANLRLAMSDEGFVDLKIKYMGELWVMLEFNSEESKLKFKVNVSVASWFSQIIEASLDFTVEGRIASDNMKGRRRVSRLLFLKMDGELSKVRAVGESKIRMTRNEDVIRSRADIMHKLHTCNKLDSMEAAQKAKVKWAVEGDENSGFFHGVINKKRNIRSIRGVMVDGIVNEVQSAFIVDGHILDGPFILNEMLSWTMRYFWEWSDNNIATLVHVLDCFHKVSGLKINMNKSKLMGTHVDHDKVTRAANKLGCQILKAPFLYLGSYVGGNMHRLKSWDDIIGRVRRRLSNWKMKMLSIGGRLTLVKSVLGSMPIFHMSLFKVPQNKASWVQWSKALASKDNGGLGISSLFALNRGCPRKRWEYRRKREECNCVSNWQREMTHFCYDNCGERDEAQDRFPHVYALEECKDITVGSKLAQPSITQSFRRMPRGGVEQMQVDDLINLASVRNYIDTTMLPKGDYQWVNLVPIKVNTFAWKVITNSLPTRFNISRRGIDIDSISCGNCDSGVETATHLFFACDLAKQITRSIMRWWDVPEMDYESYNDWRTWMINVRLPPKHKCMLEGVFYVEWWTLWNFRNKPRTVLCK
ncbi:RNA-directed DNA polymerase, eukaryota, reverse transcriptase zinc-binding domain protein [Tanacetum coccineum]